MKDLIDRKKAMNLLRAMENGTNAKIIESVIGIIRGMPQETQEAELMTKEEILEDVIPTVIWLESFDDLTAGVWVHDHYEFEDGTVDESPKEMEAFSKGLYGRKYRIWKAAEPSREQRETTMWI